MATQGAAHDTIGSTLRAGFRRGVSPVFSLLNSFESVIGLLLVGIAFSIAVRPSQSVMAYLVETFGAPYIVGVYGLTFAVAGGYALALGSKMTDRQLIIAFLPFVIHTALVWIVSSESGSLTTPVIYLALCLLVRWYIWSEQVADNDDD